jgi:hypothetical protein
MGDFAFPGKALQLKAERPGRAVARGRQVAGDVASERTKEQ